MTVRKIIVTQMKNTYKMHGFGTCKLACNGRCLWGGIRVIRESLFKRLMKSSQEGCNYQVDSNGVMQQNLKRAKIAIDCYLFKALQTNREP